MTFKSIYFALQFLSCNIMFLNHSIHQVICLLQYILPWFTAREKLKITTIIYIHLYIFIIAGILIYRAMLYMVYRC